VQTAPDFVGAFCDGSTVLSGRPYFSTSSSTTFAGANGAKVGVASGANAWVAGFDPSGAAKWASSIRYGDPGGEPYSMVAPVGDGSVFLAGVFGSSLVLDAGGPHEQRIPGRETRSQVYVARYGADGSLLWAKQPTPEPDLFVLGLSAGADGTAYIALLLWNSPGATVGAGEVDTQLANAEGGVFAVDEAGHFTKAAKISQASSANIQLTPLDDGVLIHGVPAPSLVLARGTPQETKVSGTVFYAKLNPDLGLSWVHAIAQPGLVASSESSVGLPDGSAVFAFDLGSGSATLGKGEAHEATFTATSTSHVTIVARYGADGHLLWATSLRSSQTQAPNGGYVPLALAATRDGSVWLSSSLNFDTSYPPGDAIVASETKAPLTVSVPQDAKQVNVLVRFDASGNPVWGTFYTSTSLLVTYGIAAASNTLVAMGAVGGAATFGTQTVNAATDGDLFFARFGP
jgi:hypothetical protein